MTKKTERLPDLVAKNYREIWGDESADWHSVLENDPSGMVYVGEVPLGMYDQEDLYPHLLASMNGTTVAVPLGDCAMSHEYQVAPFTYQPLPQKEIGWGRWFQIYRVALSKVCKGGGMMWPGSIRVLPGGLMELRCLSPRGFFEWVPMPGCMTQKPPGKIYERWSISVGSHDDEQPRTMVAYDGKAFVHWPEVS